MRYRRKPMTVDAVMLSGAMTLGDDQGQPGDYLVTFEDGSQCIYPSDLFRAEFTHQEQAPAPVILKQPTTPSPQKQEPTAQTDGVDPERITDCTCIDCGQTVKRKDWDPASGLGACCIPVRCPTCKKQTRPRDVHGGYCPNCLPALGGRDRG